MTLFVREYSWMWTDLHLSLAECRVYAYIYGLSHGEKHGYDGSKRHLAELLGLPKSTACKSIDALTEKHLIVCSDGLWRSVPQVDSSSVQHVDKSVPPVDSPYNPLYNNKQDKKQADMQTDFEKFWNLFSPSAEYQNRRAATQMLFEARSAVAQDAIIERIETSGKGDQPNPYFFVQDFPEPTPEFLRGDEGGDLVQVKYNGKFLICTRETMERFNLEHVRDW